MDYSYDFWILFKNRTTEYIEIYDWIWFGQPYGLQYERPKTKQFKVQQYLDGFYNRASGIQIPNVFVNI